VHKKNRPLSRFANYLKANKLKTQKMVYKILIILSVILIKNKSAQKARNIINRKDNLVKRCFGKK
jgi:hypothetical protein